MHESHFQSTWVRCNLCHARFKGQVAAGVPVNVYVASLKALRCPECGSGWKHLGMGGGMDLAEDRASRSTGHEDSSLDRYRDWKENGDVGLSSAAFVERMTGWRANEHQHATPQDPSDFRRVLLVLDRFPEFEARIGDMREVSPAWGRLVDRFDDIRRVMIEELGDGLSFGSAPRAYALIKDAGASVNAGGEA